MKKLTKVLSIILAIFAVLFLVLLITSYFKPERFGDFLLCVYEDFTEDCGHTVAGLFNRLLIITLFAFVGTTILSIGFGLATTRLPEPEENDSEGEKSETTDTKSVSITNTKEEKVFKKAKKEKKTKKSEAKVISESVDDAANTVKTVAEKTVSTSKTIDNFLDSLRNNK